MKGDKLTDQSRYCPTCKAQPGEPCKTTSGIEMSLVHQYRIPFNQKKIRYPEIRRRRRNA